MGGTHWWQRSACGQARTGGKGSSGTQWAASEKPSRCCVSPDPSVGCSGHVGLTETLPWEDGHGGPLLWAPSAPCSPVVLWLAQDSVAGKGAGWHVSLVAARGI